MSTMRPRPRLLTLPAGPFRLGLVLGLIVCLSLAGCSSTSSDLRSGGASKTKTALAVGDKPLPVVGGEPGSSVATEEDEPTVAPPSKRPEGRISGRVYDADGHPVPNAQVRLAVSSASGGKVVRAATDPSGGFTLHGLRPGTSYTLIAESPGSDGVLSGRARATASQTNVRISLARSDAPGADERAAEAPKVNVNRVSDREANEESNEPENPGPAARKSAPGESRVNEEDLPPAAAAETMAPARAAPRGGSADAGWRGGQGETNSGATAALPSRSAASATEPAPAQPETRGTAGSRPGATSEAPDDDGPNPLPPALDSGQAPSASSAAPTGAALARGPVEADPFAEESPRIASGEQGRSASRSLSARTGSSYDSPSHPTGSAPARPAPANDTPPGALVVTPETFGPVVLGDDPFTEPTARTASTAGSTRAPRPQPRNPSEPAPATAPPRPPAQPRPDASASAAGNLPPALEASPARKPDAPSTLALATATTTTTTTATTTATATAAVATRPRPTWGDVASSTTKLPPLEGASDAKTRPPVVARRDPPVRGASATTAEARSTVGPTCDYDDRHRRVIDFRLPDLEGKPFQFADLDADLILLDFWGTWCQPCIRSIPHLVDLQAKAAGKRLKVVGIACEPDAPEVSARKVAASAKKLGINYPVLLSRNDGSCPLQEALHIQALPTMVLLDRQGRVLWRDQGATPATLARLDRMIATATGDAPVMR